MSTYLNGSVVNAEFDLVDVDGVELSFIPDAISYKVLDGENVELVAETALTGYAGETTVTISVGATFNVVPVGRTRDVRLIVLECTQGSNVAYVNHSYIIETASQLETGVNSFQTYQHAELMASEMSELTGWDSASRAQRVAAMVEARFNIGKLTLHPYRVGYVDMKHAVAPYAEEAVFTYGVNQFGRDYLLSLPEDFITAIRKAQIAEADYILSSGSAEHKERDGLVSEKIGESSQSFKSTKSLHNHVCRRAMRYLTLYLSLSKKLGRA